MLAALVYLFAASSVGIEKYGVRQDGALELSDHLPVVTEFRLPGDSVGMSSRSSVFPRANESSSPPRDFALQAQEHSS